MKLTNKNILWIKNDLNTILVILNEQNMNVKFLIPFALLLILCRRTVDVLIFSSLSIRAAVTLLIIP